MVLVGLGAYVGYYESERHCYVGYADVCVLVKTCHAIMTERTYMQIHIISWTRVYISEALAWIAG